MQIIGHVIRNTYIAPRFPILMELKPDLSKLRKVCVCVYNKLMACLAANGTA